MADDHTTHARFRSRRALAAIAAALALAGCSDDGDRVPSPEASPDPALNVAPAEERLITAVENYALAQIDGDPDALVAARSEGCAVVDTELTPLPEGTRVRDIDVAVDGDEATVDYRLDPGREVEGERWVLEDGEWRWDNC